MKIINKFLTALSDFWYKITCYSIETILMTLAWYWILFVGIGCILYIIFMNNI
jgi:hypothetical protein